MGHQQVLELVTLELVFQMFSMSCTMYLVYCETRQFMVEKPTSTSSTVAEFTMMEFPEVTVCREPAFSKEVATASERVISKFYRGSRNATFVGWGAGGAAGLLEQMLTVPEDAAYVSASLLLANNVQVVANVTTKAPIYPYGRCFKVQPPEGEKVFSVYIHLINQDSSNTSTDQASSYNPGRFTVYLRDLVNSQDYFPIPISMRGSPIAVEEGMYVKYRTEVSRAVTEAAMGCKDYSKEASYNMCVREEVGERIRSVLGCSSPLIQGGSSHGD